MMHVNPPAPRRTAQRFDMRALNMLIVDDSQPSLDIITGILGGFGVTRFAPCRSVADAVQRLEAEAFDLVIADGEMPEQDGFDLTQQLRAHPEGANATVPVVIASGYTPLGKIARARDIGANMVVLKPIVPAVLLSRIEWMARHRRDFVACETYCGPDRRFRKGQPPEGADERRAEARKLLDQVDRAMSQNDIDSLFD